jgi:hypothetical protein
VQTTNADAFASGIKLYFILGLERSGNERTSYHGAETFHGESAIDGEAEMTRRISGRYGLRCMQKLPL